MRVRKSQPVGGCCCSVPLRPLSGSRSSLSFSGHRHARLPFPDAFLFSLVVSPTSLPERQAFRPPGSKANNPLDLKELSSGLANVAKGMAKKVGVNITPAAPPGTKPTPKVDKLPEHLRPPTTTWDQSSKKPALAPAFQTSFQNSAPAQLGPGGVVAPRNANGGNPYEDPKNAPSGKEAMNLGNKYAKSYSSANPPPRPGDDKAVEEQAVAAKPSFMDELGMDKEPTRKERKKKLQKIADNPGILVAAAAEGDVNEVRELLGTYELPADQCKEEGDGMTPLMAAVMKGHVDVIKVLLKAGADPELPDEEGNRALHVAAAKGYGEIVHRLCKAKADMAAAGMAGASALHLACRKGRDECVEVLVGAGASLEAVDAKGSTPLHAAASGGHEDIVEFLLLKGADPLAKDGKGKTAKSVASKKGYDDIAKMIKKAIKEAREEEDSD